MTFAGSGSGRDRGSLAPPRWLLLVLLVPRVGRLLFPKIWIEDDLYAECALLVSLGLRPYLDFFDPQPPLLEWLGGGYIKLAGASLLSLEILNQATIYLTSVLTWRLGTRVAGRRSGMSAALLYAFSALVFRYHVWEREVFTGALLAGAALIVLDDSRGDLAKGIAVAALLAIAAAIKQTALLSAVVMLGYLAIARRQKNAALIGGFGIVVLLGGLSAFCYWRYGFAFIFQTFLFHLMKGRSSAHSFALYPARILDVLLPLFVLGALAIWIDDGSGRPKGRKRGLGLVAWLIAANYAFFSFFSPTAWAHNYLDWLPFIAIVAGIGLERLIAALRAIAANPHVAAARSEWTWLAAGGLLIAISLGWIAPAIDENSARGSFYGFGFISRAEVARVSSAVRDASAPADDIIAPSFICFQANRRQFIRFPETYGVYREALDAFTRDGLLVARRRLNRAYFFDLIARTAHFWAEPMKAAIAAGKVNVVVMDPPVLLSPLVRPPLVDFGPEFLAAHHYVVILQTRNFVVWQLRPGEARKGD